MSERRRVPVTDGRRRVREARQDSPPEPGDCDCPRLEPDDWHEVESDWADITFLKESTGAVLGVPTGYESTRKELLAKAARIGATVPPDAMILLGAGRFRRQVLLEVEGVPSGTKGVVRPGGLAFSRLVSAPWGRMQRVVDETRDRAREKYGREPDDIWVWYLTCRICSRERDFETLVVAHLKHE